MQSYVGELKKLASGTASEAVEHNREIKGSTFLVTNDPRRPLVHPKLDSLVPPLDFTPLDTASAALSRASQAYRAAFTRATDDPSTGSFVAVNSLLIGSEHTLTSDAGLPNRSWFKHLLYAPGFYTGYGVKTVPGVREAIEQKDWNLAGNEIVRISRALDAQAALLHRATADLNR